jgi:hypothetical protein
MCLELIVHRARSRTFWSSGCGVFQPQGPLAVLDSASEQQTHLRLPGHSSSSSASTLSLTTDNCMYLVQCFCFCVILFPFLLWRLRRHFDKFAWMQIFFACSIRARLVIPLVKPFAVHLSAFASGPSPFLALFRRRTPWAKCGPPMDDRVAWRNGASFHKR